MSIESYYNHEYKKIHNKDNVIHSKDSFWHKIIGNPEGNRIIDIGGGDGAKIDFLVGKNECHLIDISKNNIERAGEKGILAIRHDLSERLPYEDNSFDLVKCSQVMEHLFDPEFLLKEMHRILKIGGVLFVDVPNHYDLSSRIKIFFGDDIYAGHRSYFNANDEFNTFNYPHIRFFKFHSFKKNFLDSGFVLVADYSLSTIRSPILNIISAILGVKVIDLTKKSKLLILLDTIGSYLRGGFLYKAFQIIISRDLFAEDFIFKFIKK